MIAALRRFQAELSLRIRHLSRDVSGLRPAPIYRTPSRHRRNQYKQPSPCFTLASSPRSRENRRSARPITRGASSSTLSTPSAHMTSTTPPSPRRSRSRHPSSAADDTSAGRLPLGKAIIARRFSGAVSAARKHGSNQPRHASASSRACAPVRQPRRRISKAAWLAHAAAMMLAVTRWRGAPGAIVASERYCRFIALTLMVEIVCQYSSDIQRRDMISHR